LKLDSRWAMVSWNELHSRLYVQPVKADQRGDRLNTDDPSCFYLSFILDANSGLLLR